jgi:two-component system phosphate regulon sensor histidine kinase PhoR
MNRFRRPPADLRRRLTLTYVTLVVVALALSASLISVLVNRFFLDRLREDLTWQASVIDDRMARERRSDQVLTSVELQPVAAALGRVSPVRITIVDPAGKVLADSWEDPARMDGHAGRPEVRDALAGRIGSATRLSKTLGTRLFYVAVPADRTAPEVGVIRLAVKLDKISGFLATVRVWLLLVFLAVSCLGLLVSLRLADNVGRPLVYLKEAAGRLAAGELTARALVTPTDPPEIRELGQSFNSMAERLQGTIGDLAVEKTRMERIIANLSDAVVATGPDGRIVLLNPAAERLFLAGAEDAVGLRPMEFFRHHRIDALFRLAAEERSPHTADIDLRRPDRLLRGIAVPIRLDTPQPPAGEPGVSRAVSPAGTAGSAGVVAVFHDLTERSRTDLLRRNFVAAVSHELRTPVASLKALAETLAGGAFDDREAARGFLALMVGEADRLAHLVEDLLDLSRMEAGLLSLTCGSVRLNELAGQAAAAFAERVGAAGLALDRDLDPADPVVNGDPGRLLQVVSNLVENAVKFTPAGGRITLRTSTDGPAAVFEVADTGVGIEAEDLPHVFERFFRADRSRDRRTGGFGLGLAIARYIVEAHNGRIFVASPGPGRGSRFWLAVPRI